MPRPCRGKILRHPHQRRRQDLRNPPQRPPDRPLLRCRLPPRTRYRQHRQPPRHGLLHRRTLPRRRDGLHDPDATTSTEADFRGTRSPPTRSRSQGQQRPARLTRPDIIEKIHAEYLAAGADIIETNTFNATAIAQADYQLEPSSTSSTKPPRLRPRAADAYRSKPPGPPRFVAGAIGPLNRTLSMSPDVNDPTTAPSPSTRSSPPTPSRSAALLDGGVDLLLVETIFDTLNIQGRALRDREHLRRARRNARVPGDDLRHHHRRSRPHALGPDVEAFWYSIRHAEALQRRHQLRARRRRDAPLRRGTRAASPSATSPATRTPACPTRSAATTRRPPTWPPCSREFAENGLVNLVGGCCGTTPAHIAPPSPAPRPGRRPPRAGAARALRVTPRLEPSSFPTTQSLPHDRRAHQRHRLARFAKLIKAATTTTPSSRPPAGRGGANVIDVNMDEGCSTASRDGEVPQPHRRRARHRARPGHDRQLQVEVLEAGLKVRAGQGHRQLDLAQGGRGRVPRAAPHSAALRRRRRRHGLRREGQADTARRQGRDLQARLPLLVDRVGFPPEDIIFDPNILTVATGIEEHANYAVDFIEATRRIKADVPRRQGLGRRLERLLLVPRQRPVREAMHAVFLYHAIRPAWTWASSTPASSRSTTRSSRPPRARRGRAPQPPPRRHRAPRRRSPRRSRARPQEGGARPNSPGATPRRGAPRARPRQGHRRLHRRGHRGSPAEATRGPSTSSKARSWTA
jgi:5-methyltetrahydrofolate--homocysteine methyltransferase